MKCVPIVRHEAQMAQMRRHWHYKLCVETTLKYLNFLRVLCTLENLCDARCYNIALRYK